MVEESKEVKGIFATYTLYENESVVAKSPESRRLFASSRFAL